jgi:hypothetical protein
MDSRHGEGGRRNDEMNKIEYLEDGVYVDWSGMDADQVRLFTERESGTHEIVLSVDCIERLSRKVKHTDADDICADCEDGGRGVAG